MLEQKKWPSRKKKFRGERTLRLKELESHERLKEAERRLMELKHDSEQSERDSLVMRAKRYGEALTHMGLDTIDVLFFRHVEVVFLNVSLMFFLSYRQHCYNRI